MKAVGYTRPGPANSRGYQADIVRLLAPQGRFGFIDDPETFDVNPFKSKSISVHTESVFHRPSMETADMTAQGDILRHVAEMIRRKNSNNPDGNNGPDRLRNPQAGAPVARERQGARQDRPRRILTVPRPAIAVGETVGADQTAPTKFRMET